jgi:hypothetical protein
MFLVAIQLHTGSRNKVVDPLPPTQLRILRQRQLVAVNLLLLLTAYNSCIESSSLAIDKCMSISLAIDKCISSSLAIDKCMSSSLAIDKCMSSSLAIDKGMSTVAV